MVDWDFDCGKNFAGTKIRTLILQTHVSLFRLHYGCFGFLLVSTQFSTSPVAGFSGGPVSGCWPGIEPRLSRNLFTNCPALPGPLLQKRLTAERTRWNWSSKSIEVGGSITCRCQRCRNRAVFWILIMNQLTSSQVNSKNPLQFWLWDPIACLLVLVLSKSSS